MAKAATPPLCLLTAAQLKMLWEKHEQDLADGLIQYLPLSSQLFRQTCETVLLLPPKVLSGPATPCISRVRVKRG
jgi:hypothetical protein